MGLGVEIKRLKAPVWGFLLSGYQEDG